MILVVHPIFSVVCGVSASSLISALGVVAAGAVAFFRCFFRRHSMYHPMREPMNRRLMTPRTMLRMSGSLDGAGAGVGAPRLPADGEASASVPADERMSFDVLDLLAAAASEATTNPYCA